MFVVAIILSAVLNYGLGSIGSIIYLIYALYAAYDAYNMQKKLKTSPFKHHIFINDD